MMSAQTKLSVDTAAEVKADTTLKTKVCTCLLRSQAMTSWYMTFEICVTWLEFLSPKLALQHATKLEAMKLLCKPLNRHARQI